MSSISARVKKTSQKERGGRYVDRTLASFVRKTERALFAEELARRADGFLQNLDPRVKIIGFSLLIIDTILAKNLFAICFIFAIAVILAILSHIPLRALAARAWLSALIFTGIIILPIVFITPGDEIFRFPWVNLAVSKQGIGSAAFLISRVETTVTLSLVLILSTLWTHILKSLRVFGVPVIFVVILAMTYRYIYVILETAQNMLEARKSRIIASLSGKERRRLAVANIGNLLTRSVYLNDQIYLAMRSRGFRGEVYLLDDFKMHGRDWLALISFSLIAVCAFWLGREISPDISIIF